MIVFSKSAASLILMLNNIRSSSIDASDFIKGFNDSFKESVKFPNFSKLGLHNLESVFNIF